MTSSRRSTSAAGFARRSSPGARARRSRDRRATAAVVLDFSRHLRRVLEVDPVRRLARVEPGAVLDDLQRAAGAARSDLRARSRHPRALHPRRHDRNDACGVHSILARFAGEGGRTSDNVAELDVVTSDGVRLRVGRTGEAELGRILAEGGRRAEIYAALGRLRDRHADAIRAKFPRIPRRVSGYNLPALLPENGFHVARRSSARKARA
jgi:FAD/FMN-containing dehydrogenase